MAFTIYPDTDTAALLGQPVRAPISLGPGEVMRKFVPLAQLAGPDPALGNLPTTFIRIAMSGAAEMNAAPPRFELLAHDPDRPGGSPPPLLDPATAISPGTAVPLRDDVNDTDAAIAYFSPPFHDNVYLLKVTIEIAGTRLWIRITNTAAVNPHDDGRRGFVWVVADNNADASQPWIHATSHGAVPADIGFDADIGETAAETAQPIQINNLGTGPFIVSEVAPAVTSPYVISGVPLTLGPNASANITVGFNAVAAGEFAPTVFSFVTGNNSDPGPFGSGHNNQFILRARASSKVWMARAPLSVPRAGFVVAAAGNGKLYAIGGFLYAGHVDTPTLRTVEEYDPMTDHWTIKQEMPSSRSYPLAVGAGGKIFVFGGAGADAHSHWTVFRTFEEYDPATGNWTTREPVPEVFSVRAVAEANGKIYCVGSGPTGEYDPIFDTWTQKAPMLTSRSGFALAAAGNGKLYAVGGSTNGTNVVRTVEEYDPVTDQWTTKKPLQTARQRLGLAAANNGRLYAVGGTPATRAVEEYDPLTDAWTPKPSLLVARDEPGLAKGGNGRLYVVGGENPNAVSSSVEEFAP